MTFASLYINHKLRPTYREWGRSAGERIADAVGADAEHREKIIKISTVTTSVGLSLGCAVLTADAYGLAHAAVTSLHAEVAHAVATGHAEAIGQAAGTHTAVATAHPASTAAMVLTAKAISRRRLARTRPTEPQPATPTK
jgi:hypothetical protein